jgi:hypothetical protein
LNSELERELAKIDVNRITPLEALQTLDRLKKLADDRIM